MAVKKSKFLGLPNETKVEVVFIKKGNYPLIKETTYINALSIKPKKGWSKRIFQLGFSSFKNVKKI